MIEDLINDVLRQMGVNSKKPAQWIPNIDRLVDESTGEIFREYHRGYICSYCGKHSWSKKEKCDGCGNIMLKEGVNNAE